MEITATCTWETTHTIEAPAGESAEDFRQRLLDGDEEARDHALDQVDSGTAELRDWSFNG